MRSLSVLAFVVCVSAEGLSCPPMYQMMEGRCIRALYLFEKGSADDFFSKSRPECNKDGATLPIIKDDKENEIFDNIAGSFVDLKGKHVFILLDLQCNSNTRRLEWTDGTPAEYSRRNTVNFNFDCVEKKDIPVSEPANDDWMMLESNYSGWCYTVFCVIDDASTTTKPSTTRPTEKPAGDKCGDYSSISDPTDEAKSCFKGLFWTKILDRLDFQVFTNALSWNEAERTCASDFGSLLTINSAEENKFFWRTAIAKNIIDRMHIGAHQSSENAYKWIWSDGDVPISGKAYDNFVNSFPIPGAGECSSMMAENTAALWVNENCDENEQPFMCRRAGEIWDFSAVPSNCPTVAPKAGKDFFPPGFPDPDTPCEYLLFVSANKLVELTVTTLVVDANKDFLEILEGSSLLRISPRPS
ncbi:hypothetical protein PMAYCL1PPCAC_25064 [Pristionchus mayeri]|uniref:C-type lectin domain-containing protein n=1 Tax=Pristionchus mayeri TaxID=1317129 RepID=A0AAN5I812_9BILA|nr:hypothetical protein PMAYCL1PPCAC_25064 [Pristionchus mayeri]